MVLGVYGDARGWWEHRSFLTNLTSSLTSVMFGIPTALLLVAHLGNAQAEALQQRQARQRARREIAAFHYLVLSAFSTTNLAALGAGLASLDRAQDELERIELPRLSAHPETSLLASSVDRLRTLEATYQQELAALSSSDPPQRKKWLHELKAHWEALDQDLRPQVVEADQRWITPTRSAEMRGVWEKIHHFDRLFMSLRLPADSQIADLGDATRESLHHNLMMINRHLRQRRECLEALHVLLGASVELGTFY
ncbi:hypothetical protein [Streptomyces sp. 1222.5]|uniref:hypothetical protein n=1 Tax=Streptomyces sp. 1222.5 TaxID=1881026 RepID=UPI003EC031FD